VDARMRREVDTVNEHEKKGKKRLDFQVVLLRKGGHAKDERGDGGGREGQKWTWV